MKNTTLLKTLSPAVFLFQCFGLFSQTTSSSCDTVWLLTGANFPASIYRMENDTIFHFDCGASKLTNNYTLISGIDKIHYKDGRLTIYSISPGDSSLIDLVETFNGKKYRGLIYHSTDESVTLVLKSHETVFLKRSAIKSILHIKKENINPRIREKHALKTNYIISGSNFGLNPGEGYYKNGLLLHNYMRVGITRNFSLGMGITPAITAVDDGLAFIVCPQVHIPVIKNWLNIGAGSLLGTLAFSDGNSGFRLFQGSVTVGNFNNNFTLGLGSGRYKGRAIGEPLVTLGAKFYVSPRLSIIVESLNLADDVDWISFSSIGVRHHFKKVSVDWALAFLSLPPIPLPWVTVTLPFQM